MASTPTPTLFSSVTTDTLRRIAAQLDESHSEGHVFRIGRRVGHSHDLLVNPTSPLFQLSRKACTVLNVTAPSNLSDKQLTAGGIDSLEFSDMELSAVERDPSCLDIWQLKDITKFLVFGSIRSRRDCHHQVVTVVDAVLVRLGSAIIDLELQNVDGTNALRWMRSCTALQYLYYRGRGLSKLLPVWREIGTNLKRIEISYEDEEWPATLDALRAHCKKLEDIHLGVGGCGISVRDEAARFIISYGEQVRTALLYNVDPEICAELVHHCRNASIIYVELELRFNSIAALGDRVSSLSLALEQDSDDDELNVHDEYPELEKAMLSCRHLTALDVGASLSNPLPMDAWNAVFIAPLRHLRHLTLPTVADVESVLRLISKQARDLESLSIACKSIANASAFATFVRNNSRLQSLNITEMKRHVNRKTDDDALGLITELLQFSATCSSIRKFKLELQSPIPQNTSIRDLTVPWRYRGVQLRFDFLGEKSIVLDGAGSFQVIK